MPGIARPIPSETNARAANGGSRFRGNDPVGRIRFLGIWMVEYGRYVVYLLASRKLALIEKTNPDWNDLFDSIVY